MSLSQNVLNVCLYSGAFCEAEVWVGDRSRPYFFDPSKLRGDSLAKICEAFAKKIREIKPPIDVVYTPPYKNYFLGYTLRALKTSSNKILGMTHHINGSELIPIGFTNLQGQKIVVIVDTIDDVDEIQRTLEFIKLKEGTVIKVIVLFDYADRSSQSCPSTVQRVFDSHLISVENLCSGIDLLENECLTRSVVKKLTQYYAN